MCTAMGFQVVVLAGDSSKELFPMVSTDFPKALLPVGNRPVLSYTLELLEASGIKNLMVDCSSGACERNWSSYSLIHTKIRNRLKTTQLEKLVYCRANLRLLRKLKTLAGPMQVVSGEEAAVRVGGWITGAYHDRLHVEVAAVPEDAGTADALRAVAHHLTADDILVVSGDLVCDVPLGAVAATHRRQQAALTALLCTRPAAIASDGVTGSGIKDKMKQPSPSDIIGLDPSHQFLLFVASGAQIEKDIRIRKSILRASGQMEIRTDLVDAHLYAFKRFILQEVLEHRPGIRSIKRDLVPYIVRSQLRLELSPGRELQLEDGIDVNTVLEKSKATSLLHLPSGGLQLAERTSPSLLRCCVYLASKDKYCARVNSILSYADINRDVAGDAIHLTGYVVSNHNNVVDPTAHLGSKSTVGPHCIVGEGSQLGDKCSVKRSVVGRHCRIGSNVKIMNSIVMNHVTIEDGCHIQGSIVCSNVTIQERVALKDCQVGPGYLVATGSEHRAEALAKKERI